MASTNENLVLKIADEFDDEWVVGNQPEIPRFLTRVPETDRTRLLELLIAIDIDYRIKNISDLSPEYYSKLGSTAIILARQHLSKDSLRPTRVSVLSYGVQPLPGDEAETAASVSGAETTATMEPGFPNQFNPGEEFGRYQIISKLGRGGMGFVYKARDTVLERHVALKVPHLSVIEREHKNDVIRRFHREARAMASLNHPNLCQVFDVGCIDKINFLTMALIEGVPLSDHLKTNTNPDRAATLQICRKVALALEQAHQMNVIHRDLKPSNVMLTADGEPVIIDFGLARRPLENVTEWQTTDGQIVGTPAFMSPEQIRGKHESLAAASDIFSLGILAFLMLTGRLPFTGKGIEVLSQILEHTPPNPSSIRDDIPSEIDRWCLKLLAKEPERRFQSMLEVADEIEKIASSPADRASVQRISRKTVSDDYLYDVFVSFCPADDQQDPNETQGWVSRLILDVEWRLCQLRGRTDELSVVYATDPIHETTCLDRPRYLDSKIVLIVNSPGYSNTIWKLPEFQSFRDNVNDRAVAGSVVVVEKDRQGELTPDLEVLDAIHPVRFWNQLPDGDVEIISGTANESRYFGKVDDVARQLLSRLSHEEKSLFLPIRTPLTSSERNPAPVDTPRVFLAEVTDDLDPVREEVRRYLDQTGVEVFPKNWFSRDKEIFLECLGRDLAEADLFVQLLGPVIGKKPPGSAQSYAELQYAAARQTGKPVMQWRCLEIEPQSIRDDSHRELLFGSQVQCSSIQEFKRELARHLIELKKTRAQEPQREAGDSFVFLNIEPNDAEAADELCQILDQSGFCYALPLHKGRPQEIGEDLEANLVDCDALIIYYGAASGQWVREQLRIWRRVLHKRTRPVSALAIIEGPPDEKSPVKMRLPNMEIVDCKNGLDRNAVLSFLKRLSP